MRITTRRHAFSLALAGFLGLSVIAARADEPPALNPFGATSEAREGSIPGYVELSDGTVKPGLVSLTRDAKLKVYDDRQKRQREVPLSAIKRVDARVEKEWLEPEWRFKENANDEKVFTGRNYPAREYAYVITLSDGRELKGPLSALVYVQPEGGEPEKFLLHKRDKGMAGMGLKALVYVKSVRLGAGALEEGRRRAEGAPGGTRRAAVSRDNG